MTTSPPRPAGLVRDEVVDVVVMLLAVGTTVPQDGRVVYGLPDVPLVAAMTLPLLVRRRFPRSVFTVVYVATTVGVLGRSTPLVGLGVLVALYTLAARAPRPQALVGTALLELPALVTAWRVDDHDSLRGAVFITGTVLAALALGLYAGTREAYLQELRDRARRLEHERDQQSALAASAERARIARELHDVVAHHLTVMVTLSDGAAAAVPTAPDAAVQAVREVAATGRRALTDTRRLLGVLRDDADSESLSPLPDLAGLDTLVDRVRAAGLPVTYEVHGSGDAVPPAVQLTVYRLVQEALTNTLKHAGPGTTATVRLRYDGTQVAVDVLDDGTRRAPLVGAGAGRGLTGMRERAAAYGGSVSAGPRPSGGWSVSALLPLEDEGPA